MPRVWPHSTFTVPTQLRPWSKELGFVSKKSVEPTTTSPPPGWDFDNAGQSRQLCGTTAFQLVPDYPACPACGKVMSYIGAVAGPDLTEGGVGTGFLFLHESCELAAVVSQFS